MASRGKNEKRKEKRRKITFKKGEKALKMHLLGYRYFFDRTFSRTFFIRSDIKFIIRPISGNFNIRIIFFRLRTKPTWFTGWQNRLVRS